MILKIYDNISHISCFCFIASKVSVSFAYRINEEIKGVPQVRIIGENTQGDVMSFFDARAKAKELGLDLIEIAPEANPPVCKIADFGKMKYEAKRKELEKKKNARRFETKEIRISSHIEKHDYDVKMRHAIEFLKYGHKVNFMMTLYGRENQHKDIGVAVFAKAKQEIAEIAKIESDIKVVKNKIFMLAVPK